MRNGNKNFIYYDYWEIRSIWTRVSTSIKIVEFQDESEIKSIDITSFDGCPIEMILMPSRLSEFMQKFRVYHVMEIGSSDDDGMPDDIFG